MLAWYLLASFSVISSALMLDCTSIQIYWILSSRIDVFPEGVFSFSVESPSVTFSNPLSNRLKSVVRGKSTVHFKGIFRRYIHLAGIEFR
jgi:hypothetical protein